MSPNSSVTSSPSKVCLETKAGAKAFLRQRSSSLPRILPPILDNDESNQEGQDDTSFQQQDRQSNVVVREIQKFVCRQATDVSHLLPLPIPTNSRQGKSLKLVQQTVLSRPLTEENKIKMHLLTMETLAKVHGILFAIKTSIPSLYFEFASSLGLADKQTPTVQNPDVLRDIDPDLDVDKTVKHVSTLCSSSALPFSIIVHGDLRQKSLVFKRDDNGDPISLKLTGLVKSYIGSPLLDLYAFILDLYPDVTKETLSDLLPEMLKEYHCTFNRTCTFLRVHTYSLTLKQLAEDFAEFFAPGVIVNDLLAARINKSEENVSDETRLSETCIKILKSKKEICRALDRCNNHL